MNIHICFDTPHLYYLPQYLPVYHQLTARGVNCTVVLYEHLKNETISKIIESEQLNVEWVKDTTSAFDYYQQCKPQWAIFGNGFSPASKLAEQIRTALLFHSSGTSPKSANLDAGLGVFSVRFVSGPARLEIFRKHFPEVELVVVGFAKLDPIFSDNSGLSSLSPAKFNLDQNRKTILYSPTFYPSSIENMDRHWPDKFESFNIIVKPHDFTRTKPEYRKQLDRILEWDKYNNVYLANTEDYSLVPFLKIADIMISDTSSAIFEFAALDKPVIICDFVKLRWSYRGPLRFRLKKRLDETTKIYQDIAAHATRYSELEALVREHIEKPELLSKIRNSYMDDIMGPRDGKASNRIADYLLEHIK